MLGEGRAEGASAAAVGGGRGNDRPGQTFDLIQPQKAFGARVFPQLLAESFEAYRNTEIFR